ncbi:MAG: glycosyltransferase family 39 protein [Candidatus Sumerlaeaceae bacterium]
MSSPAPECTIARPGRWYARLRLTYVLLIVITAVGATLRVRHSDVRQFWGDEVHTYQVANEPHTLSEVIDIWWEGRLMSDPPTYYILSFLNTHGSASHDHLRIRLFSLLFGVIAIPYTYLLFRRLNGNWEAVAGAALMALCTFAIQYSQEYRPYSMLLCTTLLFCDALIATMQGWSRRRGAYLYTSAVLLLYTHYFGGFVLAAGYIVLFAYTWVVRRDESRRLPWLPVLLMPVVLGVVFSPMLVWGLKMVRFQSARFGGGDNAAVNLFLFQSIKDRSNYLSDLLYSFSAWRLGTIPPGFFQFILYLAGAGLLRLALVRPRVFACLVAWGVISLAMSLGFYELMKFPYEPRRNIIHLPLFLFALAQGIGFPAALARRWMPTNVPLQRVGQLLSIGLFAVMAGFWGYEYPRYDARGIRNETNQADWRGMAEFVNRTARPQDAIVVSTVPDTWERLHFMFYHEQISPNRKVQFLNTREEVESVLNAGTSAWHIVTQPYSIPKELLQLFVTEGQWFNFYGGSVIFIGAHEPAPAGKLVQNQVIGQPIMAALGGDRYLVTGDVMVTGPLSLRATLDSETSAAVLSFPPGVYRSTVTYAAGSSTASLAFYPRLNAGEWYCTKDFSAIDPVGSLIKFRLHDGQPTIYMQYNGVLKYRYFLDAPGLYRFTLEAKNDVPGPLGVRIFFSRAPEPEKMWFDQKNNKFSPLSREVRLAGGMNEMRIYYDSFTRAQVEVENPDDMTNEFESTRWKLERIGD